MDIVEEMKKVEKEEQESIKKVLIELKDTYLKVDGIRMKLLDINIEENKLNEKFNKIKTGISVSINVEKKLYTNESQRKLAFFEKINSNSEYQELKQELDKISIEKQKSIILLKGLKENAKFLSLVIESGLWKWLA